MWSGLKRHSEALLAAVLTAALTAGGPALAQTIADFARNADKLDGRDSVSCTSAPAKRALRYVAACQNGRLPNNIIAKARNSEKLDGRDSSKFLAASGKAADANRLDGIDSTGFYAAGSKVADADRLHGLGANQRPGPPRAAGAVRRR